MRPPPYSAVLNLLVALGFGQWPYVLLEGLAVGAWEVAGKCMASECKRCVG